MCIKIHLDWSVAYTVTFLNFLGLGWTVLKVPNGFYSNVRMILPVAMQMLLYISVCFSNQILYCLLMQPVSTFDSHELLSE